MNVGNATIVQVIPWWQMTLYCAVGFFGLLTALGTVMWVLSAKKNKAAK